MKYLKINTEETADLEALKNAILQMKGIESIEIIDEENPESDEKSFCQNQRTVQKRRLRNIGK
jgi:cell division protein FtsX